MSRGETWHDRGRVIPPVAGTAALVHLSGSRRGTTERISGPTLTLGTSPDADVRLPPDPGPTPLPVHAKLHARGLTYELVVEEGAEVWVNGESVRRLVLASGDVMEFGQDGPILRFRIYPPGSRAYKSLYEAFSDCVECASKSESGRLATAARVAAGLPREVATQTSRVFRGTVAVVLALLLTSTVLLARRAADLEQRFDDELTRLGQGIQTLAERNRDQSLSASELASLTATLRDTERRLESLEAETGSAARVVADAMAATLFLQGAYAFVHEETERPLRLRVGPDGEPQTDPRGGPRLTLDGEGPVFEVFYTGTGFVVDGERGLVVTNRHVAVPWAFDENARGILDQGFRGVMRRFRGYLPGQAEAITMELVADATDVDVAVVRARGLPADQPSLDLVGREPSPGDVVFVVGFPLGVRALVARTDPAFLEALDESGETGFWVVARRLAEGGHIAPLASRGIVGQVTPQAIVYDAETTSGGSGGPVIAPDGSVVAVNTAIVPGFGGSNLGVPAARALELVDAARGGASVR